MDTKRRGLLTFLVLILFTVMACTIDFGGSDEPSKAEQTLQALQIEQTLEALDDLGETGSEEASAKAIPTKEIVHSDIPDEPGWVSQWWIETDSSITASQKKANGGDFFNQNLLERPFTAQEMEYRPDVDLIKVEISQDTTFYYFILHLSGVNPANNILSAYYGVELDTDRDSRGDVLVWALGDGNTQWQITDVFVYNDANDDVGGSRPLMAEAPNYTGDSYEKILFSIDHLDDPDAAWKRVDPSDPSIIQLAVKKSILGNASAFLWNGWADDGVKDPTKFDYNDFFTLSEAGSPILGTADYPLKDLFLTDNTCRLPFGFEPTGNEPNVCYVPEPEPEPEPQQPCDCASYPNYTFIDDEECCIYCGYSWGGTDEFPCYVPGPEPPCDCGSFGHQSEIEDQACCEYCGFSWSNAPEWPCY